MGNDTGHLSGSDRILLLCIDGGRELVHLHQNVRAFLSRVDNLVAAETILVAVLLVSGAFQYGVPPVTLRLRFVADRRCLRVEVDDHQPFSSDSRPDGYGVELPDRLASEWGLEPSDDGTRTWVEIAVVPNASASR
jgi:hypothetical protein